MFADNSVDEAMRNLESCEKISQTVETCHANIIAGQSKADRRVLQAHRL